MVTIPTRRTASVLARFLALVACVLACVPADAQQGSTLLLWPVNSVIESDARAAALWLENPGDAPVTLQVQVYAWSQGDGRNIYQEQQDVIGTPPVVTIAPQGRQLIRLTRTAAPGTAPETAYRVIVDEIPARKAVAAPGAAVSFRMRYSLPLFVYSRAGHGQGERARTGPSITWHVGTDEDGSFLQIRNAGTGHARLTDLAFAGAGAKDGNAGLFGYVLAGAIMRWPVAEGEATGELHASVNGGDRGPIERAVE